MGKISREHMKTDWNIPGYPIDLPTLKDQLLQYYLTDYSSCTTIVKCHILFRYHSKRYCCDASKTFIDRDVASQATFRLES